MDEKFVFPAAKYKKICRLAELLHEEVSRAIAAQCRDTFVKSFDICVAIVETDDELSVMAGFADEAKRP